MDMLGEQSFQPYAINTFSHRGKNFEEIPPIHYVRPHEVRSYTRRDGTLVSGYWRDGDGDTTGYYSRNPNAVPKIVRIGGKLLWNIKIELMSRTSSIPIENEIWKK